MKSVRHRYIAFAVKTTPMMNQSRASLVKAILNKIRERSSSNEPIEVRFQVISYDSRKSIGIVKIIPHTAVQQMKKLVLSIDTISNQPAEISILATSGTIKSIREKYIARREPPDKPKEIKAAN